jgi:hypothetical protein
MRIAMVKRNSAEATPVQLEDGPAGDRRLAALCKEHGASSVTLDGKPVSEIPVAVKAAPAKKRARKKAAKK